MGHVNFPLFMSERGRGANREERRGRGSSWGPRSLTSLSGSSFYALEANIPVNEGINTASNDSRCEEFEGGGINALPALQ